MLQLFYSPTSPYARKVRLVALEHGLDQQLELIATDTAAVDNPPLFSVNPLGKVPALVLEDGETLFDSPVICRYLDSLATTPLLPTQGWQQFSVLRWEAVADGLMDASYNRVMEERARPEQERSPKQMLRWESEIRRTLHYCDAHLAQLGEQLSLAHLALGAALGYVELRLPQLFPHTDYPQLQAWYEVFKQRPAMQATQP